MDSRGLGAAQRAQRLVQGGLVARHLGEDAAQRLGCRRSQRRRRWACRRGVRGRGLRVHGPVHRRAVGLHDRTEVPANVGLPITVQKATPARRVLELSPLARRDPELHQLVPLLAAWQGRPFGAGACTTVMCCHDMHLILPAQNVCRIDRLMGGWAPAPQSRISVTEP